MAALDGERIRSRMRELGLSQSLLGKLIGVSQPTIARLINGDTRESGRIVELARALETTTAYLTGDVDDPTEGEPPRPTFQMLAREKGITFIPKLDLNFALGSGNFVDGHVSDTLEPYRTEWVDRLTRGLPAKLFLTQGDGDSMVPTIFDGDDVIVNKADNIINKQDLIWAVGYGDFVAIKRVRGLADGTYLLMSDNAIVPPIETTAEELRVIGRVIWVGRRM